MMKLLNLAFMPLTKLLLPYQAWFSAIILNLIFGKFFKEHEEHHIQFKSKL